MTSQQARDKVVDRMFHGTSHHRYGKRMCGADCLGCNALTAYALAVHVEACHLRHATGSIGGVVQTTECGDDWYCDQAPRG